MAFSLSPSLRSQPLSRWVPYFGDQKPIRDGATRPRVCASEWSTKACLAFEAGPHAPGPDTAHHSLNHSFGVVAEQDRLGGVGPPLVADQQTQNA